MSIFYLPDLGEGLAEAEIHEWHVKVGDHVDVDDLLVSMETAKAVVEVPAPQKGVIKALYGEEGDIIETGKPLMEFESDAETAEQAPEASKAQGGATVAGNIEVGDAVIEESATGVAQQQYVSGIQVLPSVRAMAMHLNVNLEQVTPTGDQGQITAADVKRAAGIHHNDQVELANPEALKGVRRTMAQVMSQSHAQVVPVLIVDDADISAWPEKTDITLRVLRAISHACKVEPALNAHYDGSSIARECFAQVNLGLAMDAGDGLFVPVLKDVANQSDDSLRSQIENFKQQVKDRNIDPKDMQDATITLSNFGVFAGRYASPIVVPPCVAIIGTGRYRDTVVWKDDKAQQQRILPISVSFDHRAATGGEASRFLGAMMDDLNKAE